MTGLTAIYLSHPLWVWMGVGAILLAVEVMTGSGWLLWPAACAAVVGLITLTGLDLGIGGAVAVFAALTIVSSLTARRFAPGLSRNEGGDINDRAGGLTGQTGVAASAFVDGDGRVLVNGAEWAARLEDGGEASVGAKLIVVRVLDGARLLVTPLR
jgi:membrane protein implicated in regulation of membrane protease activity